MTNPTPQRHILALNNEQAVLDLFRDLLTEEGYRVTTRQYADKDLDAIVALKPDLIILDYMWPEEDGGWSLLQMLRMDRRTAKVPIVLCTGAKQKVEELDGHLQQMGVRVVLKPFDLDVLLAAITDGLAEATESGEAHGRDD